MSDSMRGSEGAAGTVGELLGPSGSGSSAWRRKLRAALPSILLIVAVLLIWEISCRLFSVPAYILPSPSSILNTLVVKWSKPLSSATWVTLSEVVLGFALSLVTGIGIAVILHASEHLRRAIYPLLKIGRAHV